MSQESLDLDNEGVLSFTRKLRVRLATSLTEKGLPTDPKDISALNQTLNDLDRQALVLKRMDQDKKRDTDNRAAAVIIAQLNQMTGNTNPFRLGDDATNITPATLDPLAELDKIPDYTPPPGVTFIGIVDDNYDNFVTRLNQDGLDEDDGVVENI